MKVYLAARCSRRLELVGYAEELRAIGYEVTSRWLDGTHEASDWTIGTDHLLELQSTWAAIDLEDVKAARFVISFTEEPRSGHSRGGRHVEFGYAAALGKSLIVVGPRENVFHTLPEVTRYEVWWQARTALAAYWANTRAGAGVR